MDPESGFSGHLLRKACCKRVSWEHFVFLLALGPFLCLISRWVGRGWGRFSAGGHSGTPQVPPHTMLGRSFMTWFRGGSGWPWEKSSLGLFN